TQRRALEGEVRERLRRRARLRKDKLELIAGANAKLGPALRAHADPVEACRGIYRAVGFNRDNKAAPVQLVEKSFVGLQERLAAGEHDKAMALLCTPFRLDGIRQSLRRR